MFKSVGGLAGGLPRPAVTAVSLPSGYVEICFADDHRAVENRQRVIKLYELLRPSLHPYLSTLGLSPDQAEDVIQESFLRLVRHVARGGPIDNLRGWVFRVARNLSVDLYRFERRWYCGAEAMPVLHGRVDPAPNPEEQIILAERKRQFEDACAQLTPKQRQCVSLRAEGLRYREIAVVLGVSVQRVGELMHRAISVLECGGQSDSSMASRDGYR